MADVHEAIAGLAKAVERQGASIEAAKKVAAEIAAAREAQTSGTQSGPVK